MLVAWHITDGKAGHVNQALGLLDALARRTAVESHAVPAPSPKRAWVSWAARRFAPGEGKPRPDLLIAAGHNTHMATLAARRCYGGKSVVLMKPSLPVKWFDLCVVPEHDEQPERKNVITTRGVLNRVTPGDAVEPSRGLILVGGPSKHHGWDREALLTQVRSIVEHTPGVSWRLTTSRRTPADTTAALVAMSGGGLEAVPVEQTGPDWVARELRGAGSAWVTEDSVSMVYEALSSGAAVGVLAVPRRGKAGRVVRGLDRLAASGAVTGHASWLATAGGAMKPGGAPLREADRVAGLILERWGLGAGHE